jgi:phage terminase large subunit-like protein
VVAQAAMTREVLAVAALRVKYRNQQKVASKLPAVLEAMPALHPAQQQIVNEARRYNVLDCGRRFGKDVLLMHKVIEPALEGYPVAWFNPSYPMLTEVWRTLRHTLQPVTSRVDSQQHRIELVTGGVIDLWSLDSYESARGRKYKRVAINEAAMVRYLKEAWLEVIRPTLTDLSGDAWFASTPKPSGYFRDLYDKGQDHVTHPEWQSWKKPTSENPHILPSEIEAARRELPWRTFQQEYLAEFLDDVEGALWKYTWLEQTRVTRPPDQFKQVVVAIDPATTSNSESDETGIVVVAKGQDDEGYVLEDLSGRYSPDGWARRAIQAYHDWEADRIIAEKNNGGDMVSHTLGTVDKSVPIKLVHASRGKQTRAEPVAALYEQSRVHHVGTHTRLEDQMCRWIPGEPSSESPDRVDALVWGLSDLLVTGKSRAPISFS